MKSKLWLLACVVICSLALTGCQQKVETSGIFSRYEQTVLRRTGSAQVLTNIIDNESELLSQSENVVAACGRNKKGSIIWFNAVAFDEDQMYAVRKYCLVTNEKSKSYFVHKSKKFRFDAELVLAGELLQEPYADENTRRIAFIKSALDSFTEDLSLLVTDNQTLQSGSLMVKQTFKTILTELKHSPAKAAKLNRLEGMDFDHMTLGKGRMRMLIRGDRLKIKMKIGTVTKDFHEHQDVLVM